jgi:uracil-DNA glycosylase family 4
MNPESPGDAIVASLLRCKGCPSQREACVPRTCSTADVAIVFDHPSEAEDARGEWLAGKRGGVGDLMRGAMEHYDADPHQTYLCSALNCRPQAGKKALMKNAMIACRERLVQELKVAGVKKVLCVGAVGYSALTSSKKLLAVTKIRGRWKQAYGMNVMATLPPGFILGDPAYFRDFSRDLEKFFTTDGPEPYPNVEVWVPENLAEAEEAMDFLVEAEWVSCDLETEGFSPISDAILAAGFGVIENETDATVVILDDAIIGKKKPWRRIRDLVNDPDRALVFHNAKFDLQFLKTGLEARGLRYVPAGIHDTMMLNYLRDERPIGKYKSHGLEALSRVRYDAPDYGIDVGKFLKEWAEAPELDRRDLRRKLHIYLALDCYYTARLFPDLWNEAVEECDEPTTTSLLTDTEQNEFDLMDLYEKLLMPGTLAIAEIEHRGISLDLAMYEETRIKLERKAKRLKNKICKSIGNPEFNPGSPQQVKELMYNPIEPLKDDERPGLGLPFGLSEDKDGKVYHTARRGGLQEGPTAAPVLKSLAFRYPEHKKVIDDICEHRNYTKNIGTYVVGLLNRVDSDGKLRTTFNLNGTSTGRLSSSGPNLQNVPDASHTGIEIRGGFVAEEGRVFVEADYKQLEVRIAAWLADDDAMREVFESGRDPHQEIAFSIYKKPKEEITHYMRWLAKNILFGLLYGRGAESVATGPEQEDIAARGGARWGIEDVKKFFSSLLEEWEDFAAWQQRQRELGYKEGQVTMPTGRKRRFDFIPKHDGGYVGRAAFNNPIQGTASDFTLWALIQLHAQLPEGACLVLTVHDSLMVECNEDQVEEIEALIQRVMTEETLFPIDVPLAVDIDVSRRWGEKEYEKQHQVIVDA